MSEIPEEAVEILARKMSNRYSEDYNADYPHNKEWAKEARRFLRAAAPAIREQILEEMIARIECERLLLDSPYGKTVAEIEGDLTYNRAIDDAIAAIEEVDKGEGNPAHSPDDPEWPTRDMSPVVEAFREKVCPVPDFPGTKKACPDCGGHGGWTTIGDTFIADCHTCNGTGKEEES